MTDFPFDKRLDKARLRLIHMHPLDTPKEVHQCPSCGYCGSRIQCECGTIAKLRYTLIYKKLFNDKGQQLPIRRSEGFPITNLREFRKSNKISPGDICELFGIKHSQFNRMELGKDRIPQHILEWMNLYEKDDAD